ncbi:hypothetical protein ABPG74_015944 [Tetrahymena malaccensis]
MKVNQKRNSYTNQQSQALFNRQQQQQQQQSISSVSCKNLKSDQYSIQDLNKFSPSKIGGKSKQKLIEFQVPRANLDLSSQQQGNKDYLQIQQQHQQSYGNISSQNLGLQYQNNNYSSPSSFAISSSNSHQKYRSHSSSKILRTLENSLSNNINNPSDQIFNSLCNQSANQGNAINNSQLQHSSSLNTAASSSNNNNNLSQLNLSTVNTANMSCNSPSNFMNLQMSFQNGFTALNSSIQNPISPNPFTINNSAVIQNQQQITPISLSSQMNSSLYSISNGSASSQAQASQGFNIYTQQKLQILALEQMNKCIQLSSYKEAQKIIESNNITAEDIYQFKERSNENIILHSLALRQDSSVFLKYLDTHMTIEFNQANSSGQTPLMLACQKGNYDVARFLVSHKSVDINSQDLAGNSSLHYACMYGQRKIVEMLLGQKQVQSYIKNNDEKQPKDMTQDSKILQLFNKFRKVNLDQSYSSGSAAMNITLSYINKQDLTNTSQYKDSPRTNSRSRQNNIQNSASNSQHHSNQLQRSHSNSSHSSNLQSLHYNFVSKLNKSTTKNTYLTLKQALNSQNQTTIQGLKNDSNPNSNKGSSVNSPIIKRHHSPNIHLQKAKSAIHPPAVSTFFTQTQQQANSPTDFILKGLNQLNESQVNLGNSNNYANNNANSQSNQTSSQVLNNSISMNYFDKNFMTPNNNNNNNNNNQNNPHSYLSSTEGSSKTQPSQQLNYSTMQQQNQQFNQSMNALFNLQPFSQSKSMNNFLQSNTQSLNSIANQINNPNTLTQVSQTSRQATQGYNQMDNESGSLNYIPLNYGMLESVNVSTNNFTPSQLQSNITTQNNIGEPINGKKSSQPNLSYIINNNSNLNSNQKTEQAQLLSNGYENDGSVINNISIVSPSKSIQNNTQYFNYKTHNQAINNTLNNGSQNHSSTAKTQCNSPLLQSAQMQNHLNTINKIIEKKQRSRSQNQFSKAKSQTGPISVNQQNGNNQNSQQPQASQNGQAKISTFGTNATASTPMNKDQAQENKNSSDSNESTNNTLQTASQQAFNHSVSLKTQGSSNVSQTNILSNNSCGPLSATSKANFFNSQNQSTKNKQNQQQNASGAGGQYSFQSAYTSPQLQSSSFQPFTNQIGHIDQIFLNSQSNNQNNLQQNQQALLKYLPPNKQSTPNQQNQNISQLQTQQIFQPSMQPSNQSQQYGIEIYSVYAHLGSGNYGDVYLVEHNKNKKKYAMKLLDKEKLIQKNMMKYAIAERNVMQKCNSPFIVKMYHSFQTDTHLVITMDYCPGGDLYTYLLQKKRFEEELAVKYLSEILLAVEELHYHDVIYRDMKPENIVLGSDGHVKLIDFGLSRENMGEGVAQSFCGSAVYLAPEIISKKGHNKSVDWYQFGVLAYELMVGQPPFNQLNRKELYFNIQNKKVEYPPYLSSKAKSLISALLNKNPEERLGSGRADAQQIKDHPFFDQINWFDVKQKIFDMPKPPAPNPIKDFKVDIKLNKNNLSTNQLIQGWYYIDEQELI